MPTHPTISSSDVRRLRALAARQSELSKLPVMAERRKLWLDVNDCVPGAKPPVALENCTFNRDFMPEALLQCESKYARVIEFRMLEHIRRHEILNDDHVCPDYLEIPWHITMDEFGVKIPTHYEKDSEGVVTGYRFDCPISDLEKDSLDFLKPSSFELHREETLAETAYLNDIFGDLLPVRLGNGAYLWGSLTQRLMRLMNMETFFLGMYTAPDKIHAVMRYLTDNARSFAEWAERENLLILNNGNQCTCGTCFNFTSLLPKAGFDPEHVRLKDMWGVMDSQETVGVSPEFFREFCFPYYQEIAEQFGLLYFGCCEPVDPIWDSVSEFANLHAVSISRWADQWKMGEFLQGKNIVYSRKPNPNLLSVDAVLNEEAWRSELRATLEVIKKYELPAELVVRDVYTLHGKIDNAAKAVSIARETIAEYF